MAGSVKRNAYMEMSLQGEQKKAAATMTQVATPNHSPANGRLVKELHSTSAALHKHRETGKPSVDVGQHTSHQVEMGKQKENKDTRKTFSICAHQIRTTRTNSTLTKGIDDTGVFHVFHVWIWFAQRPSFSSYELKDKR
jgi:hypothetical protein